MAVYHGRGRWFGGTNDGENKANFVVVVNNNFLRIHAFRYGESIGDCKPIFTHLYPNPTTGDNCDVYALHHRTFRGDNLSATCRLSYASGGLVMSFRDRCDCNTIQLTLVGPDSGWYPEDPDSVDDTIVGEIWDYPVVPGARLVRQRRKLWICGAIISSLLALAWWVCAPHIGSR